MKDAAKEVGPKLAIRVSVTDYFVSKMGMVLDP